MNKNNIIIDVLLIEYFVLNHKFFLHDSEKKHLDPFKIIIMDENSEESFLLKARKKAEINGLRLKYWNDPKVVDTFLFSIKRISCL